VASSFKGFGVAYRRCARSIYSDLVSRKLLNPTARRQQDRTIDPSLISGADLNSKRSRFFSCAAGRMRVYFRQSGRGMFAPACGFRAARRLSSQVTTDSRVEVNPLTPRGDRRRGVGRETTHGRRDLSLRCMNRPTKNCGLRRQQPGRPRDHGSPLRREERSQKRCVRQLF
jgi:hypothetical protein